MTVLNIYNRVPDWFKPSLIQYVRDDATEGYNRVDGGFSGGRHRDALGGLEQGLSALSDESPLLGVIYDSQINSGRAPGGSSDFHPGPEVMRVIARAGFTPDELPKPAELIEELVRAAQVDVVKALRKQAAQGDATNRERDRDELKAKFEQATIAAQDQAAKQKSKADQLQAENAELRTENIHLRAFAPGNDEPTEEADTNGKTTRRKKLKGAPPGIYVTAAGGLEIEFPEAETGEQKWKVLPDTSPESPEDVAGAVALREAKQAEREAAKARRDGPCQTSGTATSAEEAAAAAAAGAKAANLAVHAEADALEGS